MRWVCGRWPVPFLVFTCLVVVGCDRTTPTEPPTPVHETFEGALLSVDPSERSFWAWVGPGPSQYAAGNATFGGSGVGTFDDLVSAYRAEKQITLRIVSYHVNGSSHLVSAEVIRIADAPAISFSGGVVEIMGGALWDRRYHSRLVYVVPWTQFRQDGDYTSFEAVKAALAAQQQLCLAGNGYETLHDYAVQATRLGVWRPRYAGDYCSGR